MSWFADHVPEPAALYWQNAYPMIANEAENSDRAHRSGFKVISTHRLPSQAWWKNYYEPLREQTRQVEISPVMQLVIDEIEEEMNLFERFSDFYGYTFYVLQVRQ
jgi:serine/threonine-protein kinase HipA